MIAKRGIAAANVQAGGVSSLLNGSTPERKANALTPEQAQPIVPGVIGGPRVPNEVKFVRKNQCNVGRSSRKGGHVPITMHDVRFLEGSFSTDENVTRAFVVTGVPENFRSVDIAVAFPVSPSSTPRCRSLLTVEDYIVPFIAIYQCFSDGHQRCLHCLRCRLS